MFKRVPDFPLRGFQDFYIFPTLFQAKKVMTFFLGMPPKFSLQLLLYFPYLQLTEKVVTFFLGKYSKFSLNQVQISLIKEYLPKFPPSQLHDFQNFPS